ncbi:uncharacterized protein B0I36DRAFT_370643 [Microdochium trichocladiopsis]|uniref:Rhodopsin domain-containing protein n=1 Tax=Microdochium trichocladiopsis TaxID=1682393 RepID=A0A9P8XNW7_9PEZI|nr:uncharacterized protein B0I36DRAFT_370643 [Microdochium trichocladiopsis]KAH7007861.1 hypothetical protein B0I36DRAFT_370643 [Microdochium trichocladiopsis]
MSGLQNDVLNSAPRATWLGARDAGFPVVSESSDKFARGQLAGVITCTTAVTILVFLRFLVKYTSGTRMLLDDWTCIVAWMSIIIYAMTAIMMFHYGLGHHMSEVSEDSYVEILRWLYASSIVYIPATYVTKVTLLLLVARVFAVMEKVVRGIYIFIIALFLAYLPIQLVKMFICTPIASYWDPNIAGTCLEMRKVFVSDLCLAIITDTTILILPIPLTWSLSFSWKKKIKIGVLLGAGGAATAVTTYRLYLVIQYLDSVDSTYDFAFLATLTLLEMVLGLSCACLPTLNVLVERVTRRASGANSDRQPQNMPRTRRSQLPPDRRDEPSELSKMWTTITGKTIASSTTRAGDRSTTTATTTIRPFGSFITSKLRGGTATTTHTNVHDELPVHNHGMHLLTTHGNLETCSASEHTINTHSDRMPCAAAATAATAAITPQTEPESPDFDVEMQMSSGKPVLITSNGGQVPTGPECLRLVDAAQGRREGWLAPAAKSRRPNGSWQPQLDSGPGRRRGAPWRSTHSGASP